MSRTLPNLLNLLRAAAEPTRLRLLAVLAHGELTVGEITQILEQSQPRVSRHLRLLCDAGLLERFKEDHSVYYRLNQAADDPALRLHELADPSDPALCADRERRDVVTAARARRATDRLAEQTVGDLQEPFGSVSDLLVNELTREPIGDVLDVGTGAGFLLKTLAPSAGRAVGLDISSDALRLARTTVHGAGLTQCVFRRGDMYRLPCQEHEFDTVTMGRVLSHAVDPGAALAEAFRVLRPGGRLVLVDDFDTLEEKAAGNPLATLRRWLQAGGFHCDRLRPVDTGASHLLLTIARRPTRLQEVA